ncbi:MAG: S8 family serine peptidase [Flavisolibacter sp.]
MKKSLLSFATALLFLSLAAQQRQMPDQKTSAALRKILEHPLTDSVDILCTVRNDRFLREERLPVRWLGAHPASGSLLVRVAGSGLKSFIGNPAVIFADTWRPPMEELTTGAFDLTLNRINTAHHFFPGIRGDSVRVSIKEQLLDSTDIDLKGRYFNSGVAAASQTSHAAIMATILAGGGNTSLLALGAAPGALVTSSSFASLLPDPDAVYRNFSISVQNHSYGTGIENFYGTDARAYDQSVLDHPALVHVFSAGNSGTTTPSDGPYAGLANTANLTGSFKMAKNILTVGSLDSFYNVLPLSSRGPAFDGRVKPELVAYGEDGSSGAAALTSGTAALLQQAFKQLHQDSLPPASLVRAVLLNSAEDVGPPGIDFLSGYGSLNGWKALQGIKEGRFFLDRVAAAETRHFFITVPPGAKQLKLTLNWSDPPAPANAAKTLVNDLDALLSLPATGESWQPWVLNPAPQKDSLLQIAQRKKDTVNTVEQISLDDPAPGLYSVDVRGSRLATPFQEFALAYQIDSLHQFSWTFPTGSDVLRAGRTQTLRWQTNIPAPGQLEYSFDGRQWQTLGAVDPAHPYFQWLVPDTTATAWLRCVIPSIPESVVSDSFVISQASLLTVGFNCPDSFLLSWNVLPVKNYEVYALGDKYLEPVLQLPDSFKVFQKSGFPSHYYAVAPLVGSKPGWRSFTLDYGTQGVGCYLRTFFAILQNGQQALLSAELGSLYGVKQVRFQQVSGSGYQTLFSTDTPSLLMQYTDSILIQGANFYRVEVLLANGQVIDSPVDLVYYLPGNPVLVFPNPAREGEAIKLVAREPGQYSIQVFDAGGRRVKEAAVPDIFQQLTLSLPAGLYFIRILSSDGKIFFQKLVVY